MEQVALIGFGEAGAAFAWGQPNWLADAKGYDRKTDSPATRQAKLDEFAAAGLRASDTAADAIAGAAVVLCLVTADQAIAAARAGAAAMRPDALWCDMNSVAPDTKRAAAQAIEAAGGRYVDVAVMAPVLPARRDVPLLLSGPHAPAGREALHMLGFGDARVIDGPVGAASAVKMIRSVMVKGLEALGLECVLAAEAAGVRDEVIRSLDASWPGADWSKRLDYGLERVMTHGVRRAAEMQEVVGTLESLGTGAAMSRATVQRQRAVGMLGLMPPAGLDAKLALLRQDKKEHAA